MVVSDHLSISNVTIPSNDIGVAVFWAASLPVSSYDVIDNVDDFTAWSDVENELILVVVTKS